MPVKYTLYNKKTKKHTKHGYIFNGILYFIIACTLFTSGYNCYNKYDGDNLKRQEDTSFAIWKRGIDIKLKNCDTKGIRQQLDSFDSKPKRGNIPVQYETIHLTTTMPGNANNPKIVNLDNPNSAGIALNIRVLEEKTTVTITNTKGFLVEKNNGVYSLLKIVSRKAGLYENISDKVANSDTMEITRMLSPSDSVYLFYQVNFKTNRVQPPLQLVYLITKELKSCKIKQIYWPVAQEIRDFIKKKSPKDI